MSDVRVTLETTLDVEGTSLVVRSFRLTEALSVVPTLRCLVHGGSAETPTASAVIGKMARFEARRSDRAGGRAFVGTVVEAVRLRDEFGAPALELEIRPRLWKLGLRQGSRHFQRLAVPAVVDQVLADAGIVDRGWITTADYPAREWVVQYRESDLAFVQRILAEEGIWFVFRFDEGVDRLEFSDQPTGLDDLPGGGGLVHRRSFGFSELGETVSRVRIQHVVRPDKVHLRDFDFEKPRVAPEGKAQGPGKSAEIYDYPGRFVEPSIGKRRAQVRLEQERLGRVTVQAETTSIELAPGRRLRIEEYPAASLDELVVRSCKLEGYDERVEPPSGVSAARFVSRFEAVPTHDVPLRPPRLAPARTVPGPQTATTSGPSGEEIHVDRHGRVKVSFPWDRVGKKDETSSPFFRTCQLALGGAVFLPRTGWEAMVDFLDGDPDRPMLFQRLYNGVSTPPYPLPANAARGSIQTATTPGGGSSNELRMDDTKGQEQMFFNSSKDHTVEVRGNATESVKNNAKHEVGGSHKLHVTNSMSETIGGSETVAVAGNQSVAVQTFLVDDVAGSHTATVGGNRRLTVTGDHKMQIAGNATWTVAGNKFDLVVGAHSESTPASIGLDVGSASVRLGATGISVACGGPRTERIGALKAVVAGGSRSVDCGATLTKQVGGAILSKVGADRTDTSQGTYVELVGGAQVAKADEVTIEGKAMVSIVMGASTITLLPAMVIVAGTSVKAKAPVVDTGIVIDN